MNRRGYTLIELVTVVLIIGILANIAIPMVRNAKVRALAAAGVADVNVIRTAVVDYIGGGDSLPPLAASGTVPPPLKPSLPSNFSFTADGDLEYQWAPLPVAWQRSMGWLGIIIIRSSDPVIMKHMRSLFNGRSFGAGAILAIIVE